jgi:hypothetical protein
MPTNMPPLVDEVINLMEACQGLGANAEECYEDVVYTLHYRIAHYNLDERSLLPAIQSYYSNGSLSAIHTWAGNGGSTWYSSPFGAPPTEEEVDVGEEYELLKEGDAIQVGDEWWFPILSYWRPIKQVAPDETTVAYPFLVRRKKVAMSAVPQKWTCGHGVDPGDTSCVVCRNWSGRIVDTKRT